VLPHKSLYIKYKTFLKISWKFFFVSHITYAGFTAIFLHSCSHTHFVASFHSFVTQYNTSMNSNNTCNHKRSIFPQVSLKNRFAFSFISQYVRSLEPWLAAFPLTVPDRPWQFLTAPDSSWPPLTVPDRPWQFLTAPDSSWPPLTTVALSPSPARLLDTICRRPRPCSG
jgi:hypothetical protein